MRAIWLALLIVPISGCNSPASKQPIECPVAASGTIAGTIKESAAQIASAGQQLHYGDSNAISEVVASVRKRHPEASKGAVINFLLTAYCPGLNADNVLDQKRRRTAMKSFAKQAEKVVK